MGDINMQITIKEENGNLFKRCVRKLLESTFILRDKDEKLYAFVSRESNRQDISEYLRMIGFDILVDEKTGVSMLIVSEEDEETVMQHSRDMIGTDASVQRNLQTYHPRLRGTFPRVLGRYVREKKVTTLPEMIRKCTAMPAAVYSLSSKGIIREGFDADICIFDAEKIIDRATFTDCHNRCEGLNYVILGGEVVVKDSIYNGKRNGKLILAD